MDVSKAEYILTIAELLKEGLLNEQVERNVSEVLNRFGAGQLTLDETYSLIKEYFIPHRRPRPPGTFQYHSEDEVRAAVNLILDSLKEKT